MMIVLENGKELIARFFEMDGFIHVFIGNLSDKDCDWMFNQIFMSIRVSENYHKFKDGKKNQTEIASLGFAKTQAEKFDTTTRTIITKQKIGEYIFYDLLNGLFRRNY